MADESSGYGKRPLWQWILIYIVIGGILYFLVYNFILKGKIGGGGYGGSSSNSAPTTQNAPY